MLAHVRLQQHLLHRQSGDEQDRVGHQAALLAQGQHLAEAWRDGKGVHRLAQVSGHQLELPLLLVTLLRCFCCLFGLRHLPLPQSAQRQQPPLCRLQLLRVRRGGEGEVAHLDEAHGLHLEHEVLDRTTQDVGFGEVREVVLEDLGGVKPVAVPVALATGSAQTLIGGGLGGPGHLEGGHPGQLVVELLLDFAGVHHVLYARNGQRRLGDVGGDYAEAVTLRRGLEDAVLLLSAEEGVEREAPHGLAAGDGISAHSGGNVLVALFQTLQVLIFLCRVEGIAFYVV